MSARRFAKENSLSLFFLAIFLLALLGQAVTENWQSEYLRFALFALATVWLLQKGSPESKPVGAPTMDATGKEG